MEISLALIKNICSKNKELDEIDLMVMEATILSNGEKICGIAFKNQELVGYVLKNISGDFRWYPDLNNTIIIRKHENAVISELERIFDINKVLTVK
jgi:hypothetical protein